MGSERPASEAPIPARGRLVRLARSHPAVALGALVCTAAALYLLVSTLWQTDSARVAKALDAVLDGLRRGDAEEVLRHVSPYFSEGGLDKDALAQMLSRVLRNRPIVRVNLSVRQLDVDRTKAAATIHVTSYHSGASGRLVAGSDWAVIFEEIDGRWLVRQATPIRVDERNVAGLRAVLALGH